jgi:hypothetical protein
MFYAKLGKIELSAGPNIGFLLTATGDGVMKFSGKSAAGTEVSNFETSLKYNFFKDEAGEGTGELAELLIDGKKTVTPKTLGAYQQFSEKKNQFNRLDYGLNVGASYYFNDALYLGGRFNYGLSDISNNEADRDLSVLDGSGKPLFRKDFDRNYGIQVFVGFSF